MTSGILGIIALSVAYIGFFQTEVGRLEKVLLTVCGLVLVSHNLVAIAIAAAVVLLILVRNAQKAKAGRVAAAAA